MSLKSGGKDYKEINNCENISENIISYTISIIPPLMIDDFSDINKIYTVLIFYLIMFVVLYRSNIIVLNPLFLVFGYKISMVRFNKSSNYCVVISKYSLRIDSGSKLSTYEIYRSSVYYAE